MWPYLPPDWPPRAREHFAPAKAAAQLEVWPWTDYGKIETMKKLLGYLAMANFVCFFAVAIYLGGDALNGKSENGHFYLSSHGRLTEVSETVFRYSLLHGISVFLLIGLVLIVYFAQKKD